jgi:hypothetical protein
MKRVTYKKEFTSIQEALTKVPVALREDKNVFEMTDGNKTIEVRWEGTLEEGKAVALNAKDEALINEDVSNMKHLMGYTSEATIGTHKAKGRVMENEKFKELLTISKKKILAENLTEADLLDEGVLDSFKKAALMVGISIASFTAMAQESPEKAVDSVKTEVSKLSPEQVQKIQTATGIEFSDAAANDLFQFEPKQDTKHVKAPKLYLGKYGDIKAAIQSNLGSNGKGGYVYTVEIPDKRYIENGNVFRYIHKQNLNLDNTTIQFTHKGSPMAPKTITYK